MFVKPAKQDGEELGGTIDAKLNMLLYQNFSISTNRGPANMTIKKACMTFLCMIALKTKRIAN